MYVFPDPETLQLALLSGAVPAEVAAAPASAAFGADGSIGVRPPKALSRAARTALRRLGVVEGGPAGAAPAEDLLCWPQALPLRRGRAAEAVGPTTPVVFDLPGARVAELVGEVFRLGNDRQGLRWMAEGDDAPARALLRVVGPPYYTLLRALDRDGRDDAPRAFVERAPRVLVEVGYAHPLLDRLRPPPGEILMLRAPRHWQILDDGKFRDIYEDLEFALPAAGSPWRPAESPERFRVPLRLARGGTREAAELWVVRERAAEQLDALVAGADDRLLARLALAAAEVDGRPAVVVRVRPSKQAPPVLVLDAVAYRPYLRLPNLFLPVGTRLDPPLRRDAVARLLASDPARVGWLAPQLDGTFVPESLPDEAFRPLDDWVDYVLEREHRALDAWIGSARFDFEPFVCRDDERRPGDDHGDAQKRKKEPKDAKPEAREPAGDDASAALRAKLAARSEQQKAALVAFEGVAPDEAVRRLREREADFLAMEGPLDDPARRPLWGEMAGLNASLGRGDDATLCRVNALWEADDPPTESLSAWAEAESHASGRRLDDPAALDRLLAESKPSAPDLRTLSAALALVARAERPPGALAARLDRVQHFLERHETTLPARVSWLAWAAVARLAGGDVLALARARDRALERLHEQGLNRDVDLPAFLRYSGGGPGDRARFVRDHLDRLRDSARAWVDTGRCTAPYTAAIADLMFAYGFARLGESDRCVAMLRSGLGGLKIKDPVVGWLGRAFDARARQALEGKAAAGPLPGDQLAALDRMEEVEGEDLRKQAKVDRYKIDRLRTHSRILEPHEAIDPYRNWRVHPDDVSQELAALADLADRDALAARIGKLLGTRLAGSRAPIQAVEILRAALEFSFRLGESFARGLFDRVTPAVDGLHDLPRQAALLERAIFAAAHFDAPNHVRAYVARFDALLAEADGRSAEALEPVLGGAFRGLRKLGLRDEIARLLDRLSAAILGGRAADAAALSVAAERTGPGATAWSRTLRLLLHVAGGWSYFGQHDRAAPVLDEARALLFEGNLIPVEQARLARGYVRALGESPAAVALPRIEELFARLERVHDTYTVLSHYSLSRLELVEAVVLTLASDDFALGDSGRRWLEDDEYFVRRRIHRDVRAALARTEGAP